MSTKVEPTKITFIFKNDRNQEIKKTYTFQTSEDYPGISLNNLDKEPGKIGIFGFGPGSNETIEINTKNDYNKITKFLDYIGNLYGDATIDLNDVEALVKSCKKDNTSEPPHIDSYHPNKDGYSVIASEFQISIFGNGENPMCLNFDF